MNPIMRTPEYQIIHFDPKTTKMVWKLSNGTSVSKVLEDEGLTNYSAVNPYCHYVDTSNNTIVIINTPVSRVGIVSQNGLYMKATQVDFDSWMYTTNPDSDNAKVYHMLTNSDLH